MKASGKTRACIQIADYGELCYLNQQCEFRLGTFSECKNSQCSCKDGSHYIVAENACVKSSSKFSLLESQGLLARRMSSACELFKTGFCSRLQGST